MQLSYFFIFLRGWSSTKNIIIFGGSWHQTFKIPALQHHGWPFKWNCVKGVNTTDRYITVFVVISLQMAVLISKITNAVCIHAILLCIAGCLHVEWCEMTAKQFSPTLCNRTKNIQTLKPHRIHQPTQDLGSHSNSFTKVSCQSWSDINGFQT